MYEPKQIVKYFTSSFYNTSVEIFIGGVNIRGEVMKTTVFVTSQCAVESKCCFGGTC